MSEQRSPDFLKRLATLEDIVKALGQNQYELAEAVSSKTMSSTELRRRGKKAKERLRKAGIESPSSVKEG